MRKQSVKKATVDAEVLAQTQFFDMLDRDKDGRVSQEDWSNAFEMFDENRDGSISRKEWFLHNGTAKLFDSIKRRHIASVSRAEWLQ